MSGSVRQHAHVTELGDFARYARRLHSFVRGTITPQQAQARIDGQLAARTDTFLDVLARAVYGNPSSPYLPLLAAADVELGDVAALVRDGGVEAALAHLYDAGVAVSLSEFKRRAGEFDNPLLTSPYRALTGGSRGVRRPLAIDLEQLDHESASHCLFLEAFDLVRRPFVLWRVQPPSPSGLNNSLRHVKSGGAVTSWFTPYTAPRNLESLKFAAFTHYTVRMGRGLQLPRYCGAEEAVRVAHSLAALGTPAFADMQAGLGVRTCIAAQANGLDISGTFFRFGGEPFTEGKADAVAAAGCRAVCHYTMGETGRIAVACGDPATFDDMHFLSDKLAVLQRGKEVADGVSVGAFHFTTLMPTSPKVLINVESGDYGQLETRECGCPLGRAGLRTHVHGVRSYEKLTSEGNTFLGSDLLTLLEQVLPRRFGGDPGDYQLIEEEVDGLPVVAVVVHPSLGALDEGDVLDTVFEYMRAEPRNRLMADFWREAQTLRVVRRPPHVTSAGKILPLHLARPPSPPPSARR
jgi:hypothetical protein